MTASTETSTAHSTRGPKPHISLLLATWFGLGYLPQTPGTWGSLGGLVVSLLITWVSFRRYAFILNMEREVHFWTTSWLAAPYHLAVVVGIAAIGVVVATRAARYAQIKDPQWVVIDEVSGQLLTYYLFFWVLPLNWKTWLLGFILFRAFDIWKPFPARQLEHLPGGWGIMADDWMAGIYAALVLRVALHFRVL
jgi:phosphatidylglycerophosphatase A